MLPAGSVAQQTSLRRHTRDSCLVAPFHSPSVGGKHQGVKHSSSATAIVMGLLSPVQTPLLHFLSLSNAQCSLWLCAFLSCVGKTVPLLRTLCSSWTSLLSETFPLWASLCVGRRVCERLVGGRRPAANGTYCCIAGARLSGSLPAI